MSTIAKHTPGPWEVIGGRVFPVQTEGLKPSGSVPDGIAKGGQTFIVANVYAPERFRDGDATQVLEANARLIAAAPDMLEALVDALAIIETPVSQTPKNLLKRVQVIRAAIAKAEGRS